MIIAPCPKGLRMVLAVQNLKHVMILQLDIFKQNDDFYLWR